ncbi:MAG: GNAT family N-acetyltransferase, partial [Anaerolineae bacterium]|nr:GNAT family N-acetyltransferase [Anaerolineae bacterium]
GDREVHRFLADAARLLAARGQYIAFTLELDGTPIAWNLGAFDGSRYFEQMLSFDRSYAPLSPGMVLSVSLMRELLKSGCRYVELGPGFGQRKQRLGGVPTDYSRVEGYLGWPRWIARFRRLWFGRSLSS